MKLARSVAKNTMASASHLFINVSYAIFLFAGSGLVAVDQPIAFRARTTNPEIYQPVLLLTAAAFHLVRK
jgi:hypothetical protein